MPMPVSATVSFTLPFSCHAATLISPLSVNFAALLFDPRSIGGAIRARREGFRIRKSGTRVTQLGATFVIGPGPLVRYAHVDAHTADHAPLAEVLAAVKGPAIPTS